MVKENYGITQSQHSINENNYNDDNMMRGRERVVGLFGG